MPETTDGGRLDRLIRDLEPRAILRIAAMCDGHNIIDPRSLIDAGLPEPLVDQLTVTHRSGPDAKSTLYVAGRPVESLTGVSGLNLLQLLALALGVTYPIKLGRGFQASAIKTALRAHLRGADTPSRSESSR